MYESELDFIKNLMLGQDTKYILHGKKNNNCSVTLFCLKLIVRAGTLQSRIFSSFGMWNKYVFW